ncbi:MAG: protein kinase, partial [Candidatus Riflebacteria bacterium]|nr:protein kinase [Candidatus Riflebacteria bacterium]
MPARRTVALDLSTLTTCPACGRRREEEPPTGAFPCPICSPSGGMDNPLELSFVTRDDEGRLRLTTSASIILNDAFLQRFQLKRRLGSGRTGTVVEAVERASGRAVAVKFLERFDDAESLSRFLEEGRILSRVRHPNIIEIHDLDELQGHPFLVCEFMEGGSLKDLLAKRPKLPLDEVTLIVLDCLSGLAACHDRGIIHRDLKPDNILFTQAGKAKLADFGIARDESRLSVTLAGTLIGTPKYMSPEQARGQMVSARSDLWAIGTILYEMLAGRPPFRGSTVQSLLESIVAAEPPDIREFVPGLPQELAALMHQAISKRQEDRPATAGEFGRRLITLAAGCLGAGPLPAAPASTQVSDPAISICRILQETDGSSEGAPVGDPQGSAGPAEPGPVAEIEPSPGLSGAAGPPTASIGDAPGPGPGAEEIPGQGAAATPEPALASPPPDPAGAGSATPPEPPTAADRFAEALADPDPGIRRAAVEAALASRSRSAADALADAIAGESDPQLRSELIFALGKLGNGSHVGLLARLTGHREMETRCRAVQALACIDDPESHCVLVRCLGADPARAVRDLSARYLFRLGREAFLQLL